MEDGDNDTDPAAPIEEVFPEPSDGNATIADDSTFKKSCQQLGWFSQLVGVCAASEVGGECSGEVTFDQAVAFCASVGARVCTFDEVEAGIPLGSGCDLDDKRVWTDTPCGPPEVQKRISAASTRSLPLQCEVGACLYVDHPDCQSYTH